MKDLRPSPECIRQMAQCSRVISRLREAGVYCDPEYGPGGVNITVPVPKGWRTPAGDAPGSGAVVYLTPHGLSDGDPALAGAYGDDGDYFPLGDLGAVAGVDVSDDTAVVAWARDTLLALGLITKATAARLGGAAPRRPRDSRRMDRNRRIKRGG